MTNIRRQSAVLPIPMKKTISDTSTLLEKISQNKLKQLKIGGSLAAGSSQLQIPDGLIRADTEVHVLADVKQVVLLNHSIMPDGMELKVEIWLYDILANKMIGQAKPGDHALEPFTFTIDKQHQPFRNQRGYVGSYLIPSANRLVLAIERDAYWNEPRANMAARATCIYSIDLKSMTLEWEWGVRGYGDISVDDNNLMICTDQELGIFAEGCVPLCDHIHAKGAKFPLTSKPHLYEIYQHLPRGVKSVLLDSKTYFPSYPVIYTIDNEKYSKNNLNRYVKAGNGIKNHVLSACDKILKLEKGKARDQTIDTLYCRLIDGSLSMISMHIKNHKDICNFKHEDTQLQQITFDSHRENEKITALQILEYKDDTGTESILAETEKPKANEKEKEKNFYLYLFNTRFHEKLGKIELSSPVLNHSFSEAHYVMKEIGTLSTLSCHQISPGEDLIKILDAVIENTSIEEFTLEAQVLNNEILAKLVKLQQTREHLTLHLPIEVMAYLLAAKTATAEMKEEPHQTLTDTAVEEADFQQTEIKEEAPLVLSIPFVSIPQIEETSEMIEQKNAEGPPGGPEFPIERGQNSYVAISAALLSVPRLQENKPMSNGVSEQSSEIPEQTTVNNDRIENQAHEESDDLVENPHDQVESNNYRSPLSSCFIS